MIKNQIRMFTLADKKEQSVHSKLHLLHEESSRADGSGGDGKWVQNSTPELERLRWEGHRELGQPGPHSELKDRPEYAVRLCLKSPHCSKKKMIEERRPDSTNGSVWTLSNAQEQTVESALWSPLNCRKGKTLEGSPSTKEEEANT